MTNSIETILGFLPNGYLLLDHAWRLRFANTRFQALCPSPLPAPGEALDPAILPPAVAAQLTRRQPGNQTLPQQGQLLEWLVNPLPDGGSLVSVRDDSQAFRTLVEHSPDIITRYDHDLRCLYVNHTLAQLCPLAPALHIGRQPEERSLPHGLLEALRYNSQHVWRTGQPQRFITEFNHNGQPRVFESRLLPEPDENGRVQTLLCIDRDISEHYATRMWEADENRLLEMIANNRPLKEVMFWTCQMIENQLPGSQCSIMTTTADGSHLELAAAPSLPDTYQQAVARIPVGEKVGSCGTAAARGEMVVVEDIAQDPLWQDYAALATRHRLHACWSTPILAPDGKVLGTFGTYRHQPSTPSQHAIHIVHRTSHLMAIAIQQEQRASALFRLATRDDLTGLANRRYFLERAALRFREARLSGKPFSLLMLDIDHFKQVNDNHGHEAGDVVLQAFAASLRNTLRTTDMVCRMGGEEFAAVLPDTPPGEAILVAQRICKAIAALVICHQHATIRITVSIGLVSLAPGDLELSALIRHADQALYRAKGEGRNRVCVAPRPGA